MSMRTTKRCSKCATTFKGATCPNNCPTKHLRWVVFDDRTINGQRRRRTVGMFTSAKEAEAARVEAEDNDRRGHAVVSSSMTLASWIDEWRETQAHRFSPSTLSTFETGFSKWLLPALGDTALRDLSPTDFDRLYREMVAAVKPVTVSGYARGWHSVLNDAVKKRYLVRNPMDGSDLPKVTKVEPDLLDVADVARVLDLLDDHRYGILFRLLIVTGARRGEILGVTWDDVDLDSDEPAIRIRRSLTSSKFGTRVGPPKTESSKRTVALDTKTVAMLRDLRHDHRIEAMRFGRDEWLAAGTVLDKGDVGHQLELVIRRDDGRPLNPSAITYHWKRFLEMNGFDHVKLHSLRHAWASVAIENGVPMKTVQAQLGHSNMMTTANLYSHVTEKAQADATATVMEAFGS